MAVTKITGIAETVKILNSIDREIVKQARRDLRSGAQPVADAIKANIPRDAPLSGMVHNGRTGWKPAGLKVRVKTNFTKKAERKGYSLVSIVAGERIVAQGAAIFSIADMAGRKAKGKTRSGKAMIRGLNAKARASRYVYPAAERELPYVRDQVVGTIRKLTKTYNDTLKKG
jgi:hypothetical protein